MKYTITVKPGTSQEKIVADPADPSKLTIWLRAKAHDGEANAALIKLLSKHFDIPKSSIKISAGANSKHKIIEF